ncbi:hypothetical protein FKP32DRAFT_502204 [Trametes sanguinea]|nr:hypothetical protein FKP32DRAFT_502204 [Trametes sanguinea]
MATCDPVTGATLLFPGRSCIATQGSDTAFRSSEEAMHRCPAHSLCHLCRTQRLMSKLTAVRRHCEEQPMRHKAHVHIHVSGDIRMHPWPNPSSGKPCATWSSGSHSRGNDTALHYLVLRTMGHPQKMQYDLLCAQMDAIARDLYSLLLMRCHPPLLSLHHRGSRLPKRPRFTQSCTQLAHELAARNGSTTDALLDENSFPGHATP